MVSRLSYSFFPLPSPIIILAKFFLLKNIFIAVLFLFSVSSLAQDEFDPGFGDEGGGDAADAPGAVAGRRPAGGGRAG
jgi:hypothetical protein